MTDTISVGGLSTSHNPIADNNYNVPTNPKFHIPMMLIYITWLKSQTLLGLILMEINLSLNHH